MTGSSPTASNRGLLLNLRDDSGFTLIETLVTALVMLVVLAAIQSFLFAGFRTYAFGQDTFDAQARVELAQKYLDRSLREARFVKEADPLGRYVAVITDANNDGKDELIEYWVDYGEKKLIEYVDLTPYQAGDIYNFSNPKTSSSLVRTDIIADIASLPTADNQSATVSPNSADSGRPFIFCGDDPQLSLDYAAGWESKIQGIRTYFSVDVSDSTGPKAYFLQMYVSLRNSE
ncbi:MAG: PilW family protein [Thermoleophilia bacterium]